MEYKKFSSPLLRLYLLFFVREKSYPLLATLTSKFCVGFAESGQSGCYWLLRALRVQRTAESFRHLESLVIRTVDDPEVLQCTNTLRRPPNRCFLLMPKSWILLTNEKLLVSIKKTDLPCENLITRRHPQKPPF